jgi:hypothetical protein
MQVNKGGIRFSFQSGHCRDKMRLLLCSCDVNHSINIAMLCEFLCLILLCFQKKMTAHTQYENPSSATVLGPF